MVNKINWNKLWGDFDLWIEKKEQSKVCSTCNHRNFDTPGWDEQQTKIKQLVNSQVRELLLSAALAAVKKKNKT